MHKLIIVLFMACLAVNSAQAEIVERVIAIVNDDIVTQTDMVKFEERLRSGGLTDELLFPDEATQEAALKDRKVLLDRMIESRIIDQEVKKQNLSVPIERVEQEIRSIAKRNNISREELKAALAEKGIDFSQYQDFIKTGLERQGLIEKSIISKIKISEDDVISTLSAQSKSPVGQAFEYNLSHIVFKSDKGGSKAALERAENALQKLKGGADFEKLAAELSEDPNFELGGLLGTFKTGELAKDLEQVVQKLGAGEVSGVLPLRGDFHIVKVNKKRLIPDPRTEKAREQVRAALYEKAYKKQLRSWLDQLRQDSFIRINVK